VIDNQDLYGAPGTFDSKTELFPEAVKSDGPEESPGAKLSGFAGLVTATSNAGPGNCPYKAAAHISARSKRIVPSATSWNAGLAAIACAGALGCRMSHSAACLYAREHVPDTTILVRLDPTFRVAPRLALRCAIVFS
jgi:hypothetical protein